MPIPFLNLATARRSDATLRRYNAFFYECCDRNVPFIVAKRCTRTQASVTCDLISVLGAVGLTPEAEAEIGELWATMPAPTRRNECHISGAGYYSCYTHVPLDRVQDVLRRLAEIVDGNILMWRPTK